MTSIFNYTDSGDFSGNFDMLSFINDINTSSISPTFGIEHIGDNITIRFASNLTGGEETTLNDIVTNFVPDPVNNNQSSITAGGIVQVLSKPQTYTMVFRIIYPGSTEADTVTGVRAIASLGTNATTYALRLQDITNATTIAEITGQTNTTTEIVNLGTISNVPMSAAVFELQVTSTGSGNWTIIVSDMILNIG